MSYEVGNGLSGMLRRIVLRLLDLMGNEVEKVKTVLGMCQEHAAWKAHPFFINSRMYERKIPVTFAFSPSDWTVVGERCVVTSKYSGSRNILLNRIIKRGIFCWTVQVEFERSGYPNFQFGISPTSWRSERDFYCLERYYSSGFEVAPKPWGTRLYGVKSKNPSKKPKFELFLIKNSKVDIEINVDNQTLILFVDGTICPLIISQASPPFRLMANAWQNASLTSIAFRRLSTSTASASAAASGAEQGWDVYECDEDRVHVDMQNKQEVEKLEARINKEGSHG